MDDLDIPEMGSYSTLDLERAQGWMEGKGIRFAQLRAAVAQL
jgi:hypothetical protein